MKSRHIALILMLPLLLLASGCAEKLPSLSDEAAGLSSEAPLTPSAPVFGAAKSAAQALSANSPATIVWDSVLPGSSGFDPGRSLFQPSSAGLYLIEMRVGLATYLPSGNFLEARIYLNGSVVADSWVYGLTGSVTVSHLVQLNGTGDVIELRVLTDAAGQSVGGLPGYTEAFGYRVR